MYDLEPYFGWRDYYIAEEDENSPFWGRIYNEFEFEHSIYNYVIHPQWDEFGSSTLYLKILFTDYELGFTIIELLGEWNDCIDNDIMLLKRNVIDVLLHAGIRKFILIAENVLNFHFDMDDYYEEWFEDVENGWIVVINLADHVRDEFEKHRLNQFLMIGEKFSDLAWRVSKPNDLFNAVNNFITYQIHGEIDLHEDLND